MTSPNVSRDDFDRLMSQWMEADGRIREPEDLVDRVIEHATATRQISRWLLPERWLPMQLTARFQSVPRLAPALLIALLLLAVVATIAIIGSQPKIPSPFGPAFNGRVAYLADGQIYASNPDGSNPIQLTTGDRSASTPAWSRDGTRFAYKLISPRPGTDSSTRFGDIVVANADGSNPITIDRETEDPSPPVWSADGRWLVYSKVTPTGDQVFIAAADGSSPPLRIGNAATVNWAPIFSPDGTRVMYFVGYEGNGIGVMNRDGTNAGIVNTTPFAQVDSAMWHPDGTRIVVSARTADDMDLWILHLDGSPEQHLEVPGRAEVGPSWSPTGDRLVYLTSVAGVSFTLEVADANGANERPLPGNYSHMNPTWSPDGKRIAALNDLGSVVRLTLLDPDGVADPIVIEGAIPAGTVVADRSSPTTWQRVAR